MTETTHPELTPEQAATIPDHPTGPVEPVGPFHLYLNEVAVEVLGDNPDVELVMEINGGYLLHSHRLYMHPEHVAHYTKGGTLWRLQAVWPIAEIEKALHRVVKAYNADARTL